LMFCANFVSYGNSEPRAKIILQDALQFMQTQSYKTLKEIKTPDNKKLQLKTYHMKNPKDICLLYFEITDKGEIIISEITNENGIFSEISINDDNKINIKYEGMKIRSYSKNFITPINILKRDLSYDNNLYKLTLVKYADIPCYKITMRTKMPDAETIAKSGNLNVEYVRKRWQMFLKNYPIVTEFIIGKKVPFIYQASLFGSTGKKTFSYEYGIPVFTEKINSDLFRRESVDNLFIIRTSNDFAKIKKKILMKAKVKKIKQ
jgi:hypothetical protein